MNGIMRSTTPTIEFTFKIVPVADIVEAFLTIKQQEKLILEKELSEAVVGEKSLEWTLTQEETLKISMRKTVKIQCKYKLRSGSAYGSPVYEVHPLEILKEEVI